MTCIVDCTMATYLQARVSDWPSITRTEHDIVLLPFHHRWSECRSRCITTIETLRSQFSDVTAHEQKS